MQPNKSKDSTKIVLTGGHAATTATAVVEEISQQKKGWEMHWIGSKKAIEGTAVETLEAKLLPDMGVEFHEIVAGRLQRRFTLWTIPSIIKIPIGFFQAFYLLLKVKPKLVLSFGGFVGVPVVIAAYILGIPVILHEQTAAAGLANKLSSHFAKRIALARESSKKFFGSKKIVMVGNPISKSFMKVAKKKKISSSPVIFVTGGSRGSQAVNKLATGNLKELLEKYKVVHQTGSLDYENTKHMKNSLPEKLSKNYEVIETVEYSEMPKYFSDADIVVARAGANTVSEIAIAGRPSVLIPIPWSYQNEQLENARRLEEVGGAFILDQESATPEKLLVLLQKAISNWSAMANSLEKVRDTDTQAANRLVGLMEESLA